MPEQGAPHEGSGDQLAEWTSFSLGCMGSPGFCGPVASADPTSDFLFLLHLAQFPATVSRHCWLSGEGDTEVASSLFTTDPAAVQCDVCLGGDEHPSSLWQSGLGALTKPRRLRTLICQCSHRVWDRGAGAGGGARNRVDQVPRVWCQLETPAHATWGQGVSCTHPGSGASVLEASSSPCVAGRVGRAAGGVCGRRPRVCTPVHGSRWLRHVAATQQVLCEGTTTHLSRPAASTQRTVKWDPGLLGGGELSGPVLGFLSPGPQILLHKTGTTTPVSWSSGKNYARCLKKDALAAKVFAELPAAPGPASPSTLPKRHPELQPPQQDPDAQKPSAK